MLQNFIFTIQSKTVVQTLDIRTIVVPPLNKLVLNLPPYIKKPLSVCPLLGGGGQILKGPYRLLDCLSAWPVFLILSCLVLLVAEAKILAAKTGTTTLVQARLPCFRLVVCVWSSTHVELDFLHTYVPWAVSILRYLKRPKILSKSLTIVEDIGTFMMAHWQVCLISN